MQIGDVIKCGQDKYEVLDTLGEGGQGTVFKIKKTNDGKIYALKKMYEEDAKRRQQKVANIQKLINEGRNITSIGARCGVDYVFPLRRFASGQETYYIMECVSGKTLDKIFCHGTIERMTVSEKLSLLKKVADAIAKLHSVGYCYTDINLGNFMWDAQKGILHVIDCENAACTSDIKKGACFLIGTGFFMAPEVAFEQGTVSYASDCYALATLVFRVLTNNVLPSAYHGAAMYAAPPVPETMLQVAELEGEDDIDRNWRHFVFDPQYTSNSLDLLCKRYKDSKNPEDIKFLKNVLDAIEIWKKLDARLKNLFYQAFCDPFNVRSRPTASVWASTIDDILNSCSEKKTPKGEQDSKAQPLPSPPAPGKKTYPPFIPENGKHRQSLKKQENHHPLPNKPYLISTAGKTVAIKGDGFQIKGDELGLSQKTIGQLQKTVNGFVFVSHLQTSIQVCDANGREKGTLHKGENIVLASGDRIKPIISSVSIQIIY